MNLDEKLYRENIQLASIGSRFFAFLLDKFLISLVFVMIYWNAFSQTADDYYALTTLVSQITWQFVLLSLVYEVIFVMMYGATLGKMVLRIRIVSATLLDTPSLMPLLIRSCVKIFGEFVFYATYFLVFFSPFRQALHDYLIQSIVIKNA